MGAAVASFISTVVQPVFDSAGLGVIITGLMIFIVGFMAFSLVIGRRD